MCFGFPQRQSSTSQWKQFNPELLFLLYDPGVGVSLPSLSVHFPLRTFIVFPCVLY